MHSPVTKYTGEVMSSRHGVGARILRPGSRETRSIRLGVWRREQTEGMRSRIHPSYKTKYGVANWPSYDRALVRRGDVTLWLSPNAIATWEPERVGTRGGQPKYSNLAIEAALTLTDSTGDDALTGIALIEGITGAVASLTADAAYDTIAFYAVTAARGARVVVPQAKTAKKAWGYHRQARAENAFFRTSRSSAVLFELAVQEGRRLR